MGNARKIAPENDGEACLPPISGERTRADPSKTLIGKQPDPEARSMAEAVGRDKFQQCPQDIWGNEGRILSDPRHDPEKRARVFLESADGSATSVFDCGE